jgi:hypothetical protein
MTNGVLFTESRTAFSSLANRERNIIWEEGGTEILLLNQHSILKFVPKNCFAGIGRHFSKKDNTTHLWISARKGIALVLKDTRGKAFSAVSKDI